MVRVWARYSDRIRVKHYNRIYRPGGIDSSRHRLEDVLFGSDRVVGDNQRRRRDGATAAYRFFRLCWVHWPAAVTRFPWA
jgi:hypothetical protein